MKLANPIAARPRLDLHGLSAQLILSFIGLVLLTAIAVGVPAVWLIGDQLDRQAWTQVNRGNLVSQSLYAARQNELTDLATLTAQRPTLRGLLQENNQQALVAYLSTLQQGSRLDLVSVCQSGRVLAQAGLSIAYDPCQTGVSSGLYIIPAEPVPQVWLVAVQAVVGEEVDPSTTVILGLVLDNDFASQMRAQTGMEHTLVLNGQPLASSFLARQSASCSSLDRLGQGSFLWNGRRYYASCFPLGQAKLEAEVALDVTGIAATQRRLAWSLAAAILVIFAVASLLGTFLARRIGRPLVHLAAAASAMSEEGLGQPLAVQAGVREVTLVAQALERARADLQQTLVELRQEKAWSVHLLEAIVEGIVTLDRRGRITFFSQGAEQITGWQREQVVGHPCDQVFQTVGTDQPFSQLIPPPGQRSKIPVELRDGRDAILSVTGARLLPPEGGNARVALVFRDISEEEAVHRLLGHFLANVAHEFRTPLTALAASVELLLDQAPDLSSEELGELLNSLHLGVLGLQTLIDNLLESSSIEAGHFHVAPRPSNLSEIIADAIETMQPLLNKHNQDLVVELPVAIPVIQADPRRTVQVLVNLLANAIKYGPDNAEIQVCVTAQDDWVRVAVVDLGPGVPLEHRKNLFRRFMHAVPGNDKTQGGAGLGLSVVKAIVEAHGGQVGIDSTEQGGSVFWFTLPMARQT
jgi:PAS domain S-box-containing protein